MPGEMNARCACSEYQIRRVVEPGAIGPGGDEMTHVGFGNGDVAAANTFDWAAEMPPLVV